MRNHELLAVPFFESSQASIYKSEVSVDPVSPNHGDRASSGLANLFFVVSVDLVSPNHGDYTHTELLQKSAAFQWIRFRRIMEITPFPQILLPLMFQWIRFRRIMEMVG